MKNGYYSSTNGVLFHEVMEDGSIGYYFNIIEHVFMEEGMSS